MREEAVAHLVELGLARNEALAYVTLLEEPGDDGMTGYEVAARSSIPRSAVYTVLTKLEELGAAFAEGDKPVRYVPTEAATFLAHLERQQTARLNRAAEALAHLPRRARPEPVWILSRYLEVMQRIDAMIRSARHSVYLSLWPRELDHLRPAIAAVADRELHRVLHSPHTVECPPGFSCWIDDVTDDAQKAAWSHKGLVVVDRREALIGGTEPDAENHAVVTTNPSLVDVATNHIILDITRLAARSGRDCTADVAPMMRPHLDEVDP